MRPTSPPRQATGRVTWTLSLDLTRTRDSYELLSELDRLQSPHLRDHQVTLHVGHTRPADHYDEVQQSLVRALHSGVSLHIEGAPGAVAAYWRALLPPDPTERHRHLRLVRP